MTEGQRGQEEGDRFHCSVTSSFPSRLYSNPSDRAARTVQVSAMAAGSLQPPTAPPGQPAWYCGTQRTRSPRYIAVQMARNHRAPRGGLVGLGGM
ncbi:hypothetical protein SKAU_G00065640 [Synaphobranchus kaupii]|uniref:Uncharacterized protein n=1 Tax=Synaphobranchus kaupii TaxID=118154 RepID=A0A9Q1G6X2_SYNKA|nr:hypothetical protein SKAU_G00065640 [Synaphobranchus kaupii]